MIKIFLALTIVCIFAEEQKWKKMAQLPLRKTAAEISAKGDELWAIDTQDHIYRWDHLNYWIPIHGAAIKIGASPDGWTWIANRNGEVQRWNKTLSDWELINGRLSQINAISNISAIGVINNTMFKFENDKLLRQSTYPALSAAIGKGNEIWFIDTKHDIFRWWNRTGSWLPVPGKAVSIDIWNPSSVVMINATKQVFFWKNNAWEHLDGKNARRATIYRDNYVVILDEESKEIWTYQIKKEFKKDYFYELFEQ